ncbi:MAG TPA: CPBP family intramembrane glutamic endopeptidase [Polyangiaceae bacterium]|nr:CPBP family intramembrane glutamic endopeptidase [Polyangiaceae bacterium]
MAFDIRRFLREQALIIDAEYRTSNLPSHKAALVLVTAALALVLPKYFGSPDAFNRMQWAQELFAPLPYPELHPQLYWSAFKLLHYGLLPYLCLKLVLKGDLRSHGVRFVWEPKVWLLYASMLLIVLPLTYVASGSSSFLRTYPKYAGAGNSLGELLCWEAAYAFQFLMLEFFFRGFLTFALARYIGSLAVFVMVVPYAMIHLSKPFAECLGSIIAGTVLGTVALRTGSIYGGVAVHCVVAWGMDLFALAAKGKLLQLFQQ